MSRMTATILVLLTGLCVGVGVSELLLRPEQGSMARVDTGALGQAVWEAVAPAPVASPPACESRSRGVGAWTCDIWYTGAASSGINPTPPNGRRAVQPRPKPGLTTARINVRGDGSFTGRTEDGQKLQGCCVLLRP